MNLPRVHVAMATFNGRRWIEQQVRSILDQRDVQVSLTISDDGSTDGTREWVEDLVGHDDRVTLLAPREAEAGLAQNFLYAFNSLDLKPGEYAAFSDQDDIWRPGKLKRQVDLIEQSGSDAVSSNVMAFKTNPDGTLSKHVIRKDQPQTKWDFIFEAPSTGSSFLLSYGAWHLITDQYRRFGDQGVWLHDWYVYALVRGAGMKWHIDSEPLVGYRQHSQNALGEHSGSAAIQSRLQNMRNGRYREQFVKVAHDSARVAEQCGIDPQWREELASFTELLEDTSFASRVRLFAQFPKIRRDRFEALSLAGACLLGVW